VGSVCQRVRQGSVLAGGGSGASGASWLDWAGAGAAWEQAGARVSGLGESRLGRAREGKEGGVGRCWVDFGFGLGWGFPGFWASFPFSSSIFFSFLNSNKNN